MKVRQSELYKNQILPTTESIPFELEVLTPVHIGMGKDKDLKRGKDFLYDEQDQTLRFFNLEELVQKQIATPQFVDYVLNGFQVGNLNISAQDFRQHQIRYEDFPNLKDKYGKHHLAKFLIKKTSGIKPFIKSHQSPYIPGSSLKGAIRSALWHTASDTVKGKIKQKVQSTYGKKAEALKDKDNAFLEEVFGVIDANLMHFLQISDIPLEPKNLTLWNSKIATRLYKEVLGWKHHLRNNQPPSEEVKPQLFNTVFETIEENTVSRGSMKVANHKLRDSPNYVENNIPNQQLLSNVKTVFDRINTFTGNHLEREINFFRQKDNKNYDGDGIAYELEDIQEMLGKPNTCILRIGAGVGYYSVTGDYYFDEHKPLQDYRDLGECFKTRKILVETKYNADPLLIPMGFVKLTLKP